MKRLSVILLFALLACFLLVSPGQAQNYGAIAVGPGGSYGWAVDYNTQAGANNRALSECGGNCSVKVEFWNTCAAYALASDGSWGSAWAPSRQQAERMALAECGKYAYDCRILVYACTTR